MKKQYVFSRSLSAAVILSALIGKAVYADNSNPSWYVGASGDLTWLEQYGTGGGGNIDVGYQFPSVGFGDFRLEAEGGYHATSSAQYYTYMGNAYFDLTGFQLGSNSGKLVPYVGAGLGDATVHLSNSDAYGRYSEHDDVFAYQFMAGLTYTTDSMPNTAWSLGYRYLGSDSTSYNDNAGLTNSQRLNSNNLEIAARLNF